MYSPKINSDRFFLVCLGFFLVYKELLWGYYLSRQEPSMGITHADIHTYIQSHGKVIKEALDSYLDQEERQQQAAKKVAFEEAFLREKGALFSEGLPNRIVLYGHLKEKNAVPSASLTDRYTTRDVLPSFVLFADPFCGHCHRMVTNIQKIIEEKKGNTRILVRFVPLFGESSIVAAQALLAAHRQGAFTPFWHALQQENGVEAWDIQEAVHLAERFHLNISLFLKDLADAKPLIAKDKSFANALHLDVSPVLITNKGEKVSGYLSKKDLFVILK